jgi:outer membrane protein assembly factor BamB
MSRALGLSHPARGRRRAPGVALATVALLLGAPLAAFAAWPQFQGGGSHAGVSDGPGAPLQVAWTNGDIELGGPDARGGLSAPVVADDGTIVTVAPTAVLGFSSTDGAPVFEAERDFGPSSQPALAEGPDGPIVVFTEGFGDQPPAATATPTSSSPPSPAGDGEAFDSHVNAVDLHGDTAWSAPAQLDAVVQMPVAVDDEAAYVGDVDGTVTALDIASGEQLWTASMGSAVAGAVSLDGERAYVASVGSQSSPGVLAALEPATGDELWRTTQETIGSNLVSAPIASGAGIIVLEAGGVVCLDPEDGSLRWRTEIVNPRVSQAFFVAAGTSSAPVSAEGSVYAVDVTGRVYALEAATGVIRWDFALNDPSSISPPIVATGQVFVPTDSGGLDAINAETGHLLWRLEATGRGFLRGLADAGDTIVAVAGFDDAELIGVASDPGATPLDEPSPTTFNLGALLTGYLLGGVVLGAVLIGLLRPLRLRLGRAIEPNDEQAAEEDA